MTSTSASASPRSAANVARKVSMSSSAMWSSPTRSSGAGASALRSTTRSARIVANASTSRRGGVPASLLAWGVSASRPRGRTSRPSRSRARVMTSWALRPVVSLVRWVAATRLGQCASAMTRAATSAGRRSRSTDVQSGRNRLAPEPFVALVAAAGSSVSARRYHSAAAAYSTGNGAHVIASRRCSCTGSRAASAVSRRRASTGQYTSSRTSGAFVAMRSRKAWPWRIAPPVMVSTRASRPRWYRRWRALGCAGPVGEVSSSGTSCAARQASTSALRAGRCWYMSRAHAGTDSSSHPSTMARIAARESSHAALRCASHDPYSPCARAGGMLGVHPSGPCPPEWVPSGSRRQSSTAAMSRADDTSRIARA